MKLLRIGLITGLFLSSLVILSPCASAATVSAGASDGTPHLLTELQFTSTAPALMSSTTPLVTVASAPGWQFGAWHGSTLSVQSTASPAGSGTVYAMEGSYPVPTGGNYIGANYDVSALKTYDIYIEFWAKMPGVKEGCKFVKVFGDRAGTSGTYAGYADSTIITDYTGVDYGALRRITFGDGTNLDNDSENFIDLKTGPNVGRSSSTAIVETPQNSYFTPQDWGTGWHHFLIHVRYNSGTTSQNEVPNGEYYLEIDGKVYVNATGLYNRNPANGPINRIGFFGWSQNQSEPFQLWFYDIRISTGGFMSQPLPDPPGDVVAN